MRRFIPKLAPHPLTRGLAFFAPYFAGFDVDVVTGFNGVSQSSTKAALDYSDGRGYVMRVKDSTGDGRLYGRAGGRWSPLFDVSAAFTIAMAVTPRVMPQYTELVTLPDQSTWSGHYAHYNMESPNEDNTVKLNCSTSGASTGIPSDVYFWSDAARSECYGKKFYVSGSAWYSGSGTTWNATFFRNGRWFSDNSATLGAASIPPPGTYQPLNVGGIPATSNGFKADFSWVAIWSRRLSKQEHASLPFAMENLMLQKADDLPRRFYSISQSPTFRAAWVRSQTAVIGGR